MKRYYGFHNSYGLNMRDERGKRIGHVKAFETKGDRDAWIAADEFDGNWYREPITSTEARRYMLDVLAGMALLREQKSYMERHGSMEEIVDAYYKLAY